jgi:hypothetical protein
MKPHYDSLRQRQGCDCDMEWSGFRSGNCSCCLDLDLAQQLMKSDCSAKGSSTMNRLETIASRQRKSRARDLVFACFIAMAAVLGATTIGATIHGAMTHVASR